MDERIARLTKQVLKLEGDASYPATLNTPAKRALHNNLDKIESLALAVDTAVQSSRQDGWRENPIKTKRVKNAISAALQAEDDKTEAILELVKNQNEY